MKIKTSFKWILLFGIIIGNVISYNHAHKFTHFSLQAGKRMKPENLSIGGKIGVLFFGIDNPRPINDKKPLKKYKTVNIQSYEKLEGWLLEEEEHKGIVLLFHGYSGSKSGNIGYGTEFNTLGYSTFLLDFMGSGGSAGNETTVGVKESRDVKEAYEYIKTRYPKDEIILFGSSMGAVSIMKSIADYKIKPDKIILECPFGSMKTTIRKRFEAMNIPSFPFAELLLFYGGIQNGFNAFQHNPTAYAREINSACLLLYGLQDKRVTRGEVDSIYRNLKGEKKLKLLKESGHENYLVNSNGEWKKTINDFLNE